MKEDYENLQGLLLEKELELDQLRYKLNIAEETINAIQTGSVDALAVKGKNGVKIYTLEGAEQTYRMLVERMSEGAVTLDKQGVIVYCNAQFAKLVDLPLNNIIGHSFNEFIPVDYQNQFSNLFNKGWHEAVKAEFILLSAKSELHVYLSLNVLKDATFPIIGMIITNLSESKELEKLTKIKAELYKKNNELIKINNDLDNFIYTASHDLKAPVSNIEGLIIVLKEVIKGCSSEEQNEILNLIDKSIIRFKNTILDLTQVSKIQKNYEEGFEVFNSIEVIENIIEELNGIINECNAVVSLDLQDLIIQNFTKINFKSIIFNLLSNALKYRSPNRTPKITIKLEEFDEYILLTVQDNGLGMSLTSESKLFSLFKRFHNHVEGSGIGLYLVKRIMDNAGGRIEVESAVNIGTTFRLYFNK